jgi:hypothetical protein
VLYIILTLNRMSFKKSFGLNELHEIVNLPLLKHIVKKWDCFAPLIVKNNENDYDYNPKNICQKYISIYDKVATIKYNKSSKYPSKIGRWFCKSGVGIQSMPRIIRHTICDGLYIDLDFKNIHPTILQQICLKNNIECSLLTKYITGRDNLLNDWSNILNFTKEEVKTLYLCALNGNNTKYNIPEWSNVLREFKNIHKAISKLPQYNQIAVEVESAERTNIKAKIVNRILCTIENDCLQSFYKALDKKGAFNLNIDDCNYKVCALIFDGIQIPLTESNENLCSPDNLNIFSRIIENDTGYLLEIVRKPFNDKLDIPEIIDEDDDTDDFFVENDGDAAEHIISKYSNLMLNCNGIRYIKNNNIWNCDEKYIKSIIYGWIFNTTMKRYTNPPKFIFYNRDKSCINKCIDIIWENWFSFIPNNPTFINDMLLKSKEYLPFLNGVYSMREKKLISYDECEVQFTQQITRDFPKYDERSFNELMEKVIIPILPDEEERRYFFYCLSRALAGHYEDKKWYINRGSRNSGKGVIMKLLENAFKIYVGSFNSGVLVKKTNETNDEAKNLSWIVKLKDKRLILSNEIDEGAILWGKMIKKIASGGDTMVGRTNFKDEIEFVPQFTMLLNLNNIKGVNPVDALENCEQFYCKSKFVSKEELIEGQNFLKLKDDNIKTIIQQNNIIDAFTIYVLDHYESNKKTPESVKLSTQDIKYDVPLSLEEIILKHFRYSNDSNEKLFTNEILDYISNIGYHFPINLRELSAIIIKTGIGYRNVSGKIFKNGKQLHGYSNIVFISPTENIIVD